MKSIYIYTDGGTRGDVIGYCFVGLNKENGDVILFGQRGVDGTGNSHDAEYLGVSKCLEYCVQNGIKDIVIVTDSKHVYNQILDKWTVNQAHLVTRLKYVKGLLCQLDSWKIKWVPRDKNRVADMFLKCMWKKYKTKEGSQ